MASRVSYLVRPRRSGSRRFWWGLDFAGDAESAARRRADDAGRLGRVFRRQHPARACPSRTNSTRRCVRPMAPARSSRCPSLEAGQHLGEDWATAKGDAALGEPVYSVADGWVSVAQDFENAWGKVVFICYRLPDGPLAAVRRGDVRAAQYDGREAGRIREARPEDRHGRQRERHLSRRTCIGRCGRRSGWASGPASGRRRDGWLGPSEFHRRPSRRPRRSSRCR